MIDLTPKVLKFDSKPECYSTSKLKTYSNCSKAYEYKYIQKLKVVSISISTIIGSLIHGALEVYLHPNNQVSFIQIFEEESKKAFFTRKYIKEDTDVIKFDKLYFKLLTYSRDIKTLSDRASEDYIGEDAIRTKDGRVPSNPAMTTGWKQAEKDLKLVDRKAHLESQFNYITITPEVSLVDAFTEAYTLATLYVTPKEIVETLALEFAISDYNYETGELSNPVLMPDEFGGEEGIYLNGYIDWLGYVWYKGKKRFALIDYKTSKENLTEDKLEYHTQLLSYVYAVEKLLGIQVEVIGVHSLRHKKLALCEVDRDILKVVNVSLFSKHKKIKEGHFYQEDVPDSQYSKCLSNFGRECDYLQYCYPKMYNRLHPNTIDAEIEKLLNS